MIKSHVLFLSTLQWLKAQQVYYEILYVCVTVLLLRNSVEVQHGISSAGNKLQRDLKCLYLVCIAVLELKNKKHLGEEGCY